MASHNLSKLISFTLLLYGLNACSNPPARMALSSKTGQGDANPDKDKDDPQEMGEDDSDGEPADDGDKEGEPMDSDTGEEPDPVPDTFDVSLTQLEVKNDQGSQALKGDTVIMNVTFVNAGSKAGTLKVTPYLTSKRFTDFENVKLPTQDVAVQGTETKVAQLKLENFFQDQGGSKKEYALNRGDYTVRFEVEGDGIEKKDVKDFKGNSFTIEKSNVVFTAVYWHQSYFDKAKFNGGVMKWMEDTYSRKGEINDGNKTVKAFPKGFDEMMGIKTMFHAFEGFRLDRNKDFSATGILNQVEDYGKDRLGLKKRFAGTDCNSYTHPDNHGYDMEIGLSNDGFGGLAWVCGNTQASGIFDGDTSIGRSQMIVIHETGHNYGAPHCDPIQGFIMCSGEKHQKYLQGGDFVWHKVSTDVMKKHEQDKVGFAPGLGGLALTADVDGSMANPEIAICNHP